VDRFRTLGAEQLRMIGSPERADSPLDSPDAELLQRLRTLEQRINGTPENVEQGLAKLVLSLIEFLRRVLEKQAIRRMDGGDLSDEQIERMGLTLMRLEEKIVEMAAQFGLDPDDLNLDLGPLGRLL